MTNFLLEIQIDQAGLQTISSADMAVAILQPQDSSQFQIVALLTTALGSLYITWTDALSVYTSSYSLQAYTTLKINSQATAISGQIFAFNGSVISNTGTTSLPNTVQLTNNSGSTLTSGLAKVFVINEGPQALAITTASSLLNHGQGSFQISNKFILTLLGGAQIGMAIPNQAIPDFNSQSKKSMSQQITAQPPLLLDFTSNTEQTVHFDDQQNIFVTGDLISQR